MEIREAIDRSKNGVLKPSTAIKSDCVPDRILGPRWLRPADLLFLEDW